MVCAEKSLDAAHSSEPAVLRLFDSGRDASCGLRRTDRRHNAMGAPRAGCRAVPCLFRGMETAFSREDCRRAAALHRAGIGRGLCVHVHGKRRGVLCVAVCVRAGFLPRAVLLFRAACRAGHRRRQRAEKCVSPARGGMEVYAEAACHGRSAARVVGCVHHLYDPVFGALCLFTDGTLGVRRGVGRDRPQTDQISKKDLFGGLFFNS